MRIRGEKNVQQKRILVVSSRIPFPDTAGYKKRIISFSKILKEAGYNLDLLTLSGGGGDISDLRATNVLGGFFNTIECVNLGLFEKVTNLAYAFFSGKALQEKMFFSKKMLAKLRIKASEGIYDTVIWNHVRMLPYIEKLRVEFKSKYILDFHDSIAYHYIAAKNQVSLFWRLLYRYEGKKLLRAERRALFLCDKAWITSEVDRQFIDKNDKRLKTISMAVSANLLNYESTEKRHAICFIGKMDYNPNIDAVTFFAREVFSRLSDSSLTFYILGTSPTRIVKNLARTDKRIIVTGFMDDPYALMAECEIVVAPIRIGGGIQNKILEGMALAKPVITFSDRVKAFPGITSGHELAVALDEADFTIVLERLLADMNERKRIGQAARKYIAERFTWGSIKESIIEDL